MKDPIAINCFYILVADPRNNHNPKAKKLKQFTRAGLELLTEYYNEKYFDRPKTLLLIANYNEVDIEGNEVCFQAVKQIRSLNLETPQKILFSIANEDGENALLHSAPLLITHDKLILLTSERDKMAKKIYKKIAHELKLEFIEPLPSEKLSFQADQTSCHMIAGSILKDLNHLDIKLISTLENNYKINPLLTKLLKYSQSTQYNYHILSKDSMTSIKSNGTKLEDYVLNGKSHEFGSRIQKKHISFLQKTCNLDPNQDIKISAVKLIQAKKNLELI